MYSIRAHSRDVYAFCAKIFVLTRRSNVSTIPTASSPIHATSKHTHTKKTTTLLKLQMHRFIAWLVFPSEHKRADDDRNYNAHKHTTKKTSTTYHQVATCQYYSNKDNTMGCSAISVRNGLQHPQRQLHTFACVMCLCDFNACRRTSPNLWVVRTSDSSDGSGASASLSANALAGGSYDGGWLLHKSTYVRGLLKDVGEQFSRGLV